MPQHPYRGELPDDQERTTADSRGALEVIARWGPEILAVRHLALGEQFTVGAEGDADCFCPAGVLPLRRFPLVQWTPQGAEVLFTSAISLGDLPSLVGRHVLRTPVSARLCIGQLTFTLSSVDSPCQVPRPRGSLRTILVVAAILAAAVAGGVAHGRGEPSRGGVLRMSAQPRIVYRFERRTQGMSEDHCRCSCTRHGPRPCAHHHLCCLRPSITHDTSASLTDERGVSLSVEAHIEELRGCLAMATGLSLELTIDLTSEGEVREAHVEPDERITPAIRECLVEVARTWRIPRTAPKPEEWVF